MISSSTTTPLIDLNIVENNLNEAILLDHTELTRESISISVLSKNGNKSSFFSTNNRYTRSLIGKAVGFRTKFFSGKDCYFYDYWFGVVLGWGS
jgi:hypothetical protein